MGRILPRALTGAVLMPLWAFVPIGGALAQQPYEGTWAPSTQACSDSTSDSNFSILGTLYKGHESECTIRSATRRGSTWYLAMSCGGEGEIWDENTEITVVSPNAIALGGNSSRPTHFRCSAIAQGSQERQSHTRSGSSPSADAGEDTQQQKLILINFYTYFVGAQECAKRSWAFSSQDVAKLRRHLAEETASIPQHVRDEAWAFVSNGVKGSSGNTGSEAGCFRFKQTFINVIFPGVLDPETTTEEAPF
jgi:hypothetical protein